MDAAPVHHRGTRGAMLRRCQEARWELESEIWLRMRVNSAVVGRAAAGTEALRKAVIVRDEVVRLRDRIPPSDPFRMVH